MGRGTKPNRQILTNWVNQLQRENKTLKHEVAIHAARGMILERIVKDRLGLSGEEITKAMVEVAGESGRNVGERATREL